MAECKIHNLSAIRSSIVSTGATIENLVYRVAGGMPGLSRENDCVDCR